MQIEMCFPHDGQRSNAEVATAAIVDADVVGPFAGVVEDAAGEHDAKQIADLFWGNRLFDADRVHVDHQQWGPRFAIRPGIFRAAVDPRRRPGFL